MHGTRSLRRGARIACAVAALMAAAVAAPAFADPVRVPGSTLSMEPPDGFALSDDFTGFEGADARSSILVAELPPEAHAEISAIFASPDTASEALSPQGVTVTGIEAITVDGESVDLVVGEQRAGGLVVDKYFAVLEGELTVLVTVNAVGEGGPGRDAAIEAIESITLAAPPTLAERLDGLPFGFEAVAPFEPRQVMAGSSVALTAFEGIDPSGLEPLIVIASALAALDASDLQAASERLLARTTGFEGAEVRPGERIVSGEALAWRVEASAGERLAIHYLWPLPRGRYLRLIATGERGRLAPLADAVDAIAASVEPRAVEAR